MSWKLGGGGFTSSTEDLAKFAQGLLDGKLVTKATEKIMWTVQSPKDTTGAKPYGYGFFIINKPTGELWVGHDGRQEKTRSCIMLEPNRNRGVVLFSNSEWIDPADLAMKILGQLN